jgi:hypothetical protein
MNKHFKVTMTEIGRFGVHTFTQECFVPTRAEVIKIYGLDEPDILDYKIEEIN